MDVNHAPRCLIEVGDDVLPKVSPVRVRFSTPLSAKEMLRKTLTKTEDVFGDYISVPFRIWKKGVEAKFDTGNQAPEIDTALLRNVAKAHQWFEQLKQGQSFAEIADQEKLSTRRVQQLMDHAFLAPDIVRSIITGKQPSVLTTDYLQRSKIPENWADQAELLDSLQP